MLPLPPTASECALGSVLSNLPQTELLAQVDTLVFSALAIAPAWVLTQR
jgi:hypothetical protein